MTGRLRGLRCRIFGHRFLWYGPTFRYDSCLRCGYYDGTRLSVAREKED